VATATCNVDGEPIVRPWLHRFCLLEDVSPPIVPDPKSYLRRSKSPSVLHPSHELRRGAGRRRLHPGTVPSASKTPALWNSGVRVLFITAVLGFLIYVRARLRLLVRQAEEEEA
jgi:hypothetical protein